MDSFEEDVVQEIIRLNSIIPIKSASYIDQVEIIHLFFARLSKPLRLKAFINLHDLVIMGCPISDLSFLEECKNITRLWVCECGLQSMSHIVHTTRLKELCLFDNRIPKIEGFFNCTALRKLWLNDNDIRKLSDLERLSKLCDLNISGNKIQRLDSNLLKCKELMTLNLSGNQFYDLQDLSSLSILPNLEILRMNDGQYKPSPISSNPHSLLALIHYLPRLNTVDDVCVKVSALSGFIDSVVTDKKLFYFSKYRFQLNVLQRGGQNLVGLKNSLVKPILKRISLLDSIVRAVETFSDLSIGLAGVHHVDLEKYEKKATSLSIRKRWWESKLLCLESEYAHCLQSLVNKISLTRCLLVCELQMFGGLVISSVTEGHEWFTLCERFCQQRVCWHDPLLDSYSTLRLCKVFHIKNELLNDHVRSLYGDDGDVCLEKLLFYSCLFSCDNDLCQLGNILRCGFRNFASTENMHFSTLLNVMLKKDVITPQLCYSKSFHLLLARSANDDDNDCLCTNIQLPFNDAEAKSLTNKRRKACGCAMNHMEYIYSSGDSLIPEFLIEIELLANAPMAQFADYLKYDFMCAPNLGSLETVIGIGIDQDTAAIKAPPEIPPAPQVANSSLEGVMRLSWFNRVSVSSPASLTELNLTGTGFKCLDQLKQLRGLKSLNLSNCGLTNLQGLSCLFLELLDVSHNSLVSLETMCDANELTTLDVNWNSLTNFEMDMFHLKKITMRLAFLQMVYNPWLRKEHLVERAASILPTLLKTSKPHDDDADATSVDQFTRTQVFRNSTEYLLTVWPIVRRLPSHNNKASTPFEEFMKPVFMFDRTFFWKLPLSKISYHSLGCLSMNHTCLVDLSALTSLSQLLELSVENNCLTSLRGIHYLYNLQTLLAGNNFISSISGCGFNYLKNLQVLALDNNHISSLDSLTNSFGLKQLYVTSNRINHYRSVLILNEILSLVVLDLRFNPLTKQVSNYRQRTIFHFPHLSFFDGMPVYPSEVIDAKEALDGRLTSEFILSTTGYDCPSQLTSIDCWDRGFRIVELCPPDAFTCLRTVNLQDNQLTSFGGLLQLKNLQVLCLAGNKVSSVFPPNDTRNSKGPLLPNLTVLSLARNDLNCLKPLQLSRFPALDTLFLQDNFLTSMGGLEDMGRLRALVLDNNRLRKLSSDDFASLSGLEELHLENNRIREFPMCPNLVNLVRLYVGGNKLDNIDALCECLVALTRLRHLTVLNNPVTKLNSYRYLLCYRLPDLLTLDTVPTTDEDSQTAFMLFSNQQSGQTGGTAEVDGGKSAQESTSGSRKKGVGQKGAKKGPSVSQITLPPVTKWTSISSESESVRDAPVGQAERPGRPLPPPPPPPPQPPAQLTISTMELDHGASRVGHAGFGDAPVQVRKAIAATSNKAFSLMFSAQQRLCSPRKNDAKTLCVISREFGQLPQHSNHATASNKAIIVKKSIKSSPKEKKISEKKRKKAVLSIPGISINAIADFKPQLPHISNADKVDSDTRDPK